MCILISELSYLGRPEQPFRTGLYSARDVFFSLGSRISEALPRPIAAKLCHMIAIWRQSQAKVGQLGDPPLKNFRGQKHAKISVDFLQLPTFIAIYEYLRNGLRYPNRNSKYI